MPNNKPIEIAVVPWTGRADRIRNLWSASAEAFIACGQELIAAKAELVQHGEFLKMVETLPFGEDTAQQLMRIARNPVLSNTDHGRYLPPSWRTLYELSKVPAPALEASIQDGRVWPDMQRKEATALRGDARPKGSRPRLVARPDLSEDVAACWDDLQHWAEQHGKTLRKLRILGVTNDYLGLFRKLVMSLENQRGDR